MSLILPMDSQLAKAIHLKRLARTAATTDFDKIIANNSPRTCANRASRPLSETLVVTPNALLRGHRRRDHLKAVEMGRYLKDGVAILGVQMQGAHISNHLTNSSSRLV